MTREDEWLAGITEALNGDSPLPSVPDMPSWHYEQMLAAIYDAAAEAVSPRAFPERSWHLDEFLYSVYLAATGDASVEPPPPTCRIEEFWCGIYKALTGDETYLVPVPAWRTEELLKALYDAAVAWGATEQTLTGSVVSFVGKATTKITGLTSAIVPVQSGSGTPSPSNPRPITGFAGATIRVSPTEDPDDATTYAADWTDEAGTVYGGTVDLSTGVLTVTWAASDMGALDWEKTAGASSASGKIFITRSVLLKARARYTAHNVLCSIYATASSDVWFNANYPDLTIGVSANAGRIIVRNDTYDDDVPSFKAAMNGVYVVYELATPVTYQLTPQEISTLVGQNYVWSDTGDVTVTVKGAVSP